MLLATTVELYDGLVAHGLPGQGRLADVADSARYDAVHHHVDVLVVGAGPAGLAAALTAARAGVRVALVDEQSEAGGALLSGTDRLDDAPALDWVAAAVAELAEYPDVLHLQRTTAFGSYDDGFVLALERRTDHLGTAAPKHLSRQRVWRFRARSIVVATGAHERPVVFADNDRPGIMLAGAARTFLNRYGVLPGREAVVFTTNDSAYESALDLHRAGVRVQAVVDARTAVPARLLDECERAGIPVLRGSVVTGTRGSDRAGHDTPLDSSGGRPRHQGRARASRRRGSRRQGDRVRSAPGQRRVEPRGAPVQPGPWPAALRRGARGLRPGRGARRPGRRRCRGRCARPGRVPGRRAAGRPRSRGRPGVEPARTTRCRSPRSRGAGAHRWCCGGSRTRPARAAPPSSSTCSVTRRSPTSPVRSAPACAPSSTSSATRRSAPRTTRARPPASSPPASPPSCWGSPCRTPGRPRSGPRTRRWPSPLWPAATAGGSSTRSGSPPCTTGTSPPGPSSRTSASGSARASTRSRVRTWRPRCCASAPRRAPVSASSTAPRSARSTCRDLTPAFCSTCSTRT